MGHPTGATRYTWQSGPLTDGQQCRFVVRIATALWPSGIKTQNTDEHPSTDDTSTTVAPVLQVQVI